MENIKKVAQFLGIKDDKFNDFYKICTIKTFENDEIVYYQGEYPNALMFLISGYMGAYHIDDNYKSTFFHIFTANKFVGEAFTLRQTPYQVNVKSFGLSKVVFIDFVKFKKLFFENPQILQNIILSLAFKLDNYFNFVNREKHNGIFGKICIFILNHEELFGLIKQKEIAFILNISPQILSRYLKKLKENIIIDANDGYWRVLDREKLKNFIKDMEL